MFGLSIMNLATGVAIFVAALNTLWLVWGTISFMLARSEAARQGVGWFVDWSHTFMHARISLALIVAAACLWSRTVRGLVISASALTWVVIEYAWWAIWSQRFLASMDIPEFHSSTPHVFNIFGATGWNVAVLAIALALLLWELKTLIGLLIKARSKHSYA